MIETAKRNKKTRIINEKPKQINKEMHRNANIRK